MDRIYTGFASLDKHLKISKGDLVVIGGRPAIGKTCFLRSVIEKTASMQKTLFFTMQMKKHKAIEGLRLLNTKTIFFWESIVDFEELLINLKNQSLISVDTETTSVNALEAERKAVETIKMN